MIIFTDCYINIIYFKERGFLHTKTRKKMIKEINMKNNMH